MSTATPPHQGRILAALRTEAGMSLRALAREIDLSPSHLHRIESGERPLTPEVQRAASEAIGAFLIARRAAS